LLAYTHIAHDCTIGNDVTMSNLAQLAGHVVVEDHAGSAGWSACIKTCASRVRVRRRDDPHHARCAADFLAEGNPAEVHGLNSVGLRRRNFAAEAIADLKNAYKLIYRSGTTCAKRSTFARRNRERRGPSSARVSRSSVGRGI